MSDGTLYGLMKRSTTTKSLTKSSGKELEAERLTNERISMITKQILSALSYMHKRGYFHRDIKPENILIRGDLVKVADFGLARDISSHSPYTYYVSTRWYRAPEVILRSNFYGPPIDIFATGLILAELYSLCPLFPGESEIDQINLMIGLLGKPDDSSWEEGASSLKKMNITIPTSTILEDFTEESIESVLLRKMPDGSSPSAAALIRLMIQWNPIFRPSANEAISHDYFKKCCESCGFLKEESQHIDSRPKSEVNNDPTFGNGEVMTRANAMGTTLKRNEKGPDDIDRSKASNFSSSKFKIFSGAIQKDYITTYEGQENEFSSYISAVCAPSRPLDSKPTPSNTPKATNIDNNAKTFFSDDNARRKRFGNAISAPFAQRSGSNAARNARRDRIARTAGIVDTALPKKHGSKKKHTARRVQDHPMRPRWLQGNNMGKSSIEVEVCISCKGNGGYAGI